MKIYLRKNWVGKVGLLLIVFAFLSTVTACDVNWVTQAESLIPVIAAAIEGALGLLLAFGVAVPPETITAIQGWAGAAVDALKNIVTPLIQDYNNAPADQKATILGKIKTALDDVAGKFVNILNVIHVTNPALQTKLTTIFAAIQAQVMALLNIIPALPKLNSVAAVEAYMEEGGVVPMNAGQFKHAYQAVFKAKTGDVSVDGVVEHAKVFGQ